MNNCLNFFVTILFMIFSMSVFADHDQYAIYIDAGSTGSRLHVFQYDESSAVPIIKDIFSENVKPGLSSFLDHPDMAGVSLKKILDDASDMLQKKGVDLHTVPISVFATAGMRLLPEDKQKVIYENISHYLKHYYGFAVGDIQTISGKMEAIYGWLDVNYLLENFQRHQSTVGSIDMGGMSTQIAFATNAQIVFDDQIVMDINGQHYTVVSQSFLGMGQDKMRGTMTADRYASYCYPKQYAFKQTEIGNFNMESCSVIYTNIIQKQLADKIIPSMQGRSFVAYSGIYFTQNFFNTDKTPDQIVFERRIQSVCNKTWSELQKEYPQIAEKYLSTYCADGIYHDQLIYNAYHIQGSQLTVANQLNQKEIDWTLGALFYHLLNHEKARDIQI